jgi:hypothetical protein
MFAALGRAGITYDDADALRRISMTFHRWNEHECNGNIQRDEETGIPYWHSSEDGKRHGRVQDREKGAQKRLARIMAKYPTLKAYEQGDPRGAALYILRPEDVLPGHEVGSYYSRGIAVY